MPIDFLCGEVHFLDHLHPIWAALPAKDRGVLALTRSVSGGDAPGRLARHARACGYEGCVAFPNTSNRQDAVVWLRTRPGPLVVASVGDARTADKTGRPVAFCEHGAGQSYSSRHASYAGGQGGRRNVRLFLCPNEQAAERNRRAYPGVPAVVIGCPKLDAWHREPPPPRREPPVVALSFHWPCEVCPETLWAFPHYRKGLGTVARDPRWQLIGHGHPRALSALRGHYATLGVEVVEQFAEVVARADCYVCDNSSTMFEFASLGRPVVVLNAPWYRREVEHGLRFWEAAGVGVQCSEPEDLPEAIATALQDAPERRAAREAAVALAYAYTDGRAAQRAAKAIRETLCPSPSRSTRVTSSTSLKRRRGSPASAAAK